MSEENTKQTVATGANDAALQASNADDGAQGDELEALLAQFEAEVKKPSAPAETQPAKSEKKPTPKSEQTKDDDNDLRSMVQSLIDRDKAREADATARAVKEDMGKLANVVRGDLDANLFDDDFMIAFLDGQARKHPELVQVFHERHTNPKKFERMATALAKEFSKKWSKIPNPEATEDRAVVSAAVRGASTKPPEAKAPDYRALTNQEFASDVEKKYGFRPPV